MPPPEIAYRRQKVVVWYAEGRHGHYGEHRVNAPCELDARVDNNPSEGVDPDGNKVALTATMITDRQIPIGSAVWVGELADWLGTGSGADEDEILEVRTAQYTPDIKARFTRHTLGLARFRGEIPERR